MPPDLPPDDRLIILDELDSGIRADVLTRSQELLRPFSDQLTTIWAALWIGTLAYLILRYLLAPSLFEKREEGGEEG